MQPKGSNSIVLNETRRRRLWKLLVTSCILLLSPLGITILILLYIYRRSVEIVLRIQLRSKFAGLMKGTDVIWAAEDAVSLSVINILVTVEKTACNINAIFLEVLRNLINDRLVSKAAGTTLEKVLYLRSQKFGYYFWERSEKVELKDRIRWLECANDNCDGSCEDISSEAFRKTLANVCNKPLPDNHRAMWEILVGRRCPKFKCHIKDSRLSPEECFNTDNRKIPIIIRIHHSLGDGIVLQDVLLKIITEDDETKQTKVKNIISGETEERFKQIVPVLRNSEENFQSETDVVRFHQMHILALMSFIYVMFSRVVQNLRDHFSILLRLFNNAAIEWLKQVKIDRTWLNLKDFVLKQMYLRIKEITLTLFFSLIFLMQEALRNMDENALRGPPQTGEKIVSYWSDSDMANDKSQKLLTKIHEIRKNTGARFDDIVLAAFSASVHKYHLRINKPVPNALTVLTPIRMPMPDDIFTLDNNFSIAFLRICISNANGQTIVEPNRDSQFFNRLEDISRTNNKLRKSLHTLINFYCMKYVSALFPVKILKTVFKIHCTLGFSNICGPERIWSILNNSLSNITFWLPTTSAFALGFSVFSYGGNLHLGLIADKSIVKDERCLMELLENTVYEINTAYNSIPMHFSKTSNFSD